MWGCKVDQEHKLLTAAEAAAVLRVAIPTLYQWARQRRVPHVRLGDRLLFDVEEIMAAARVPVDGEAVREGR